MQSLSDDVPGCPPIISSSETIDWSWSAENGTQPMWWLASPDLQLDDEPAVGGETSLWRSRQIGRAS